MMIKLSFMMILLILAVGIVANANITMDDQSNEFANAQVQGAVYSNAMVPYSAPDTKTIIVLLGVGIIGFVTFSRRR
jgi:phosphate/sulfate permease